MRAAATVASVAPTARPTSAAAKAARSLMPSCSTDRTQFRKTAFNFMPADIFVVRMLLKEACVSWAKSENVWDLDIEGIIGLIWATQVAGGMLVMC